MKSLLLDLFMKTLSKYGKMKIHMKYFKMLRNIFSIVSSNIRVVNTLGKNSLD